MIASTALVCMALVIYHEARGEMIPGQYAVAQVLWRRAEGRKKNVCPEAFRARQFSWANSGVKRDDNVWTLAARHSPRDAYAWYKAVRISQMVQGGAPDFSRGADHYHTIHVTPLWRLSFERTHRMGLHIFYRSDSQG